MIKVPSRCVSVTNAWFPEKKTCLCYLAPAARFHRIDGFTCLLLPQKGKLVKKLLSYAVARALRPVRERIVPNRMLTFLPSISKVILRNTNLAKYSLRHWMQNLWPQFVRTGSAIGNWHIPHCQSSSITFTNSSSYPPSDEFARASAILTLLEPRWVALMNTIPPLFLVTHGWPRIFLTLIDCRLRSFFCDAKPAWHLPWLGESEKHRIKVGV